MITRAMLTLYQFELSPFCDKVRRVLRYKGVAFEVREVSLLAGHKHSPTRKLPAIELDGERVDDSTQIAHFLEQRFPERPLIPKDPKQRALVHVLEDWADESLYFYEMALHFGLPENLEARLEALICREAPLAKQLLRVGFAPVVKHVLFAQGTGRRQRARLIEDLTRHVQALADLLGDGLYLVGQQLTLADIAVFAEVSAMCEAPVARELCAAYPNVMGWLTRVRRETGG